MSRFFKGAVLSSDSSDSSSSEDEQQQQIQKRPTVRDFAFPSDNEDDVKRVVKTHKDRRFEELKELIKQTKNSKNIKDLSKVLSLFEEIVKIFANSKTILMRQNISTPRFYLRYLVDLEDYINEIWEDKEAKKSMSKPNAKGLAGLRQKVRKYNKEMETEVAAYRANPDPEGYSSAEEEVENAGEENATAAPVKVNQLSEAPGEPKKKKEKKKRARNLDSDSEGSDSEWASSSEESSSGESDIDLENEKMEVLRRYFLKKEFRGDEEEKKKSRSKRRDQHSKKVDRKAEEDDEEGEWTPIQRKEDRQQPIFEAKQEITHEVMSKKLEEIMSVRGRKSTNRKQHVRILQELFKIADEKSLGAGMLTKILFSIIGSLFELNAKISDFMDFPTWGKTLAAINSLLELLLESPNVHFSVLISEDEENLDDATNPYRVHGSLLLCVQRLDAELTKILQNADCHSNDYIDKLKGEKDICQLIERTQDYVDERLTSGLFSNEEICKVYMLRIEHVYYKYEDTMEGPPAGQLVERLCKKIYTLDDEKRLRQRAMLCHVYHLALHGKWHEARDLMLMSHLQAIVDHSDVSTQILYNRTICQLGLCAFRNGFIREAHQALSEIQNTQRAKELLAQALVMRQHERTQEQEKVERGRQIPYHMHINVELMECVYLICSMLLEIPHMASNEFEMRRRPLSRSFHYQLKQSEKCPLIGPPENTREHVVAASRAMLAGDWAKCRDYLVNDKMNQKVWNLFRNADEVRSMVIRRVQEESLRTYLLRYSTVYSSVSLERLSQMFNLEKNDVHAIVSKMILNEELSATLDEPTGSVEMHRVEPSRLQLLALSLSDKLHQFAESNEQLMEPRGGRGGYSGAAPWYAGRAGERGGDDKNKQGRNNYNSDRREGGRFEGKRGGWAGGQQRKRENQGGKRF